MDWNERIRLVITWSLNPYSDQQPVSDEATEFCNALDFDELAASLRPAPAQRLLPKDKLIDQPQQYWSLTLEQWTAFEIGNKAAFAWMDKNPDTGAGVEVFLDGIPLREQFADA